MSIKSKAQIRFNQKGSITILALSLTIVVAVVANSFVCWYIAHTRMQAYSRLLEDSISLQTTIKMLMSSRASCNQNLKASALGATTAAIMATHDVQSLIRPTPNGVDGGLLLVAGSKYDGVLITKISLIGATRIKTVENSYIGTLSISYANPLSKNSERSFTMPFYFMADAAGKLTDCMATQFIESSDDKMAVADKTTTIEDFMCEQRFPESGFVYYPGGRYCGLKSTSLSRN